MVYKVYKYFFERIVRIYWRGGNTCPYVIHGDNNCYPPIERKSIAFMLHAKIDRNFNM